jgi:hypothetical protein
MAQAEDEISLKTQTHAGIKPAERYPTQLRKEGFGPLRKNRFRPNQPIQLPR